MVQRANRPRATKKPRRKLRGFFAFMVAAETQPELQKLTGRHSVQMSRREREGVNADLQSGEHVKGGPPSAGEG